MAGNRDEGGGGGVTRDWAAGLMLRLQDMVDEVVEALAAEPIKTGDVAGLDRRARAITSLARAGKTVEALKPRSRTRAEGGDEDAMSEDDSDDIDPAELERLRAELQSRLDHLRAGFEGKRMAGLPVADPVEGGDRGNASAARISVRAA